MANSKQTTGSLVLASTAQLRRLARRVDALCLVAEISFVACADNGAAITLTSANIRTTWRHGEKLEAFILRHRHASFAAGIRP